MALATGTHLGRFEIRSLIGKGGMGEVYLAQDTELERTVALKVLPAEVASDKQRMQRFIQEAKAISALNHPNILTIYEIGQADSSRFIATEFIEGETLRHHLSNRRMKLGEVLDVAAQVASALAAAHAAGIAHRDIKPENIMVRSDALVKVLDFGLAKLTEHTNSQPGSSGEAPTLAMVDTEPGLVMGTVKYMSPEQARGQKVDARTDIWSLGVVIYEMVAGRVPFEGSTTGEALAAILGEKEPAPLARYMREVPVELERIVTKALTKNREERYQGAKDLLLDLKRLKQELEFAAKLERSLSPELSSGTTVSGRQKGVKAAQGPATPTADRGAQQTSSAEYLIGEIKQHTRGVVGALAVLLIAITVASFYFTRSSKATIDSVAVLPFVNVSADPTTEYLSDGVTESLINNLSQLPNVKVMSRSSVFHYKGREIDPRVAGRELGVQAVLTGRVMQRADGLSISTELVSVRDNSHLWGEQYNLKLSDLIAMQEEIAKEISEKLRLRLTHEEQKRLTKQYTANTEAYQLYLKGRYYWNKRTPDDLKKSLEYFNQAIDHDPSYALAYTGLSDSYRLLVNYHVISPKEGFPKAKSAVMKALEIDDTLVEAHTSLASIKNAYDWDFVGAEREYKHALELNPNYALAHHWYGYYLGRMGRFNESLAELRRAQELDPFSLIINSNIGLSFLCARQYDQAIEQLHKTLEMDQNFYVAHAYIGAVYVQKGQYSEAIAEYQKARQANDDPWILSDLGYVYALGGKRVEAQKAIEELKGLSTRRYISPQWIALIYTGLGEKDEAFAWLEKAYEERDEALLDLKVLPEFDSLRSDPRFIDLLRRIGLIR